MKILSLFIGMPRRGFGKPGGWAGAAIEMEITILSQPSGQRFELHVLAINKAGESEVSNEVSAVL
uniref:Fibronectin type-III domain-containing protein n=1 Tax=Candidatus Kentrum sp. FW TaxID=2126338 RepID=A0A450TFD0_9GAMM|nr:MAG: hypothetical protein BECKFW1821B_GA0114236_11081 [Candidatus Kentron sp. FW]